MNFEKLLASLLIIATSISLVGTSQVFAKPTAEKTHIISNLAKKNKKAFVSEIELFITMVDVIAEYWEIPASYQSIVIDSKRISKNTRLYKAYQKAIYMDIVKQSDIPLPLTRRTATHKKLVWLTNYFYGEKVDGKILVDGTELQYITRKLTYDDMVFYASNYLSSKSSWDPIQNAPGFEVLSDAYKKLVNEHIDRDLLDEQTLIYGAIEGMSKAANDPFTTYFPPAEATEFSEEMNGEFEGIGTYLEMIEPGVLMIISPIPGSPAEKAGILAGDRIMQVGSDYPIVKKTPVGEVITKIKWPAGTEVILKILRDGEEKSITVTRQKIKIELVTEKLLDASTAYIQISSFGNGTSEGFARAALSGNVKNASKVIIDMRNDGGWDLQEVSNILDYFVPAWKEKFRIKTLYGTEVALATGNILPFANKKVIFLTNKGTASASEILIWTAQEYLENTTTVGEKTYGKWSVQTLFPYADGSSLKFTSARWYTGKNNRTIDKVGITPDHEIILDQEAYKKWSDNQLEFAKRL
jgi:carboxyl-terminal processing protease